MTFFLSYVSSLSMLLITDGPLRLGHKERGKERNTERESPHLTNTVVNDLLSRSAGVQVDCLTVFCRFFAVFTHLQAL